MWTPNAGLLAAGLREFPHQPLHWLLLAYLLTGAAGFYTGIQHRRVRKTFLRMLNAWIDAYGEHVFEAASETSPFRLMVPLDKAEREPFALFLRRCESSSPEVQRAAWMILMANHIIPPHRSYGSLVRQALLIVPMLRGARDAYLLAQGWSDLAWKHLDRPNREPFVWDWVSRSQFLEALNKLKAAFNEELAMHLRQRNPRRVAAAA